ncbi:MAG: DUF3467 domain-containing protein [Candidatus Marinimicrobia bacterium]|nr:DUF3467 domain-containing protein [Candidatus Neomarinimicrobiota bacterium]
MDTKKKATQQIQIQVNEGVADGEYANLAIITHSSAEFIVDFVRVMPGSPKANVQSRIIMTPSHTKALYRALEQNISKYEAEHGEIKMPEPMTLPAMTPRPGNMPN